MRINEHTAIRSPNLVLVPYSKRHVPQYHSWMQNEDIQKATASEPLSLAEEYAMQQSWRQDADKLTFITGIPNEDVDDNTQTIRGGKGYAAIGDVNLFITTDFDEQTSRDVLVGELELMVASTDTQGKGHGRAALLLFLQYVLANQEGILSEYQGAQTGGGGVAATGRKRCLDYFRVKIGQDNERSLRLFGGLGFRQVGKVSYFGEIELRRTLAREEAEELLRRYGVRAGREIGYEDLD
jgi:RimJ/RimL family protein N-acetyltransferase